MSRPLRFTFILVLVGLGTALAAVGGWRFARASAPVPGPVILLSIDTLRADHLPAYGYRNVRTPAIDALARDGVVFERAYAHAVQTLPAHTAVLSGRLPFETGVRDDLDAPIKRSVRLLSEMLHDRGFATGGVVSAAALRSETGLARGFDFFDSDLADATDGEGSEPLERDGAESEAIAERWLASTGSTRVFLFLHLNEPHAPYAPQPQFAEFAPYDGEIAYADEIVGRLIRYLKAHQLYDQSTIILSSDHGEGLGDHGEQQHGLFVYEEDIHVPLIVKQAGGVGAGRRVAAVVQHIDIVPTVLDLVKAPGSDGLHGRSLKALLEDEGTLADTPVYAEAAFGRRRFGWAELTSIVDGRFHYIRAPREELYDVSHDPHERQPLDDGTPGVTAAQHALQRQAEKFAATRQTEEPSADPKDRIEIAETYRSAQTAAESYRWTEAAGLLTEVLREEPQADLVWRDLATLSARAERYDQAAAAYERILEIQPMDTSAYLGLSGVLLKARRLDDARDRAEEAIELPDASAASLAQAHALLASIALARHDEDEARRQAALAHDAVPSLPDYVDGRILYDAGSYDEALPLFERAIAITRRGSGVAIPDLHYFTADSLVRLDRPAEAESEFLEELRVSPDSVRARAGLGMLYQATDRDDEAARVAAVLVHLTPTPEGYAAAERIWSALGNHNQADALRTEARRLFSGESKRRTH